MRLTGTLPVLLLLVLSHGIAAAQDTFSRFEAGPLVSASFLNRFNSSLTGGFGGRITANLNSSTAGEFEVTHFPRTPFRGKNTAGIAQIKLTLRREQTAKLNVFVVGGYGFYRFTKSLCCPRRITHYEGGWNAGAGAEIVPARRFALRFDFTDFIQHDRYSTSHFPNLKLGGMWRF